MHQADCECRDCIVSRKPLTLDEVARLAAFLGERGHIKTAVDLVGRVAYGAVMAEMARPGGEGGN